MVTAWTTICETQLWERVFGTLTCEKEKERVRVRVRKTVGDCRLERFHNEFGLVIFLRQIKKETKLMSVSGEKGKAAKPVPIRMLELLYVVRGG